MAIAKVQTGLRLDEVTHEKLRYIASRQKRSLNAEIEFALEKVINDFESEHGSIPLEPESD